MCVRAKRSTIEQIGSDPFPDARRRRVRCRGFIAPEPGRDWCDGGSVRYNHPDGIAVPQPLPSLPGFSMTFSPRTQLGAAGAALLTVVAFSLSRGTPAEPAPKSARFGIGE